MKYNNKKADGWQLDIDDTGEVASSRTSRMRAKTASQMASTKSLWNCYDAKGHSNVGYLLSFSLKGSLPKLVTRTFSTSSGKPQHSYPLKSMMGEAEALRSSRTTDVHY